MAHTFLFATSLFAVLASAVLATNTNNSCFPGDATVQMYNSDLKLMRDLEVGDKVHTASDMIELSEGHFIPVDAKGKLVYKRAKDLQVGETLWGSSQITELSKVEKLGLYNPFTLSGNIMVNNVEASSHSEWFLDSLFDAIGATEYLPYAYQAVLAPLRAIYNIVGKEIYGKGYAAVNSCVNVAEFGMKHGGSIALTIGIDGVATAMLATKA
ncbi:warthog protein 6 isoform X2 [Selaginella moellendorffii]|uniref:warthog protein 6 isoform X2 n=1 Tax=Selaginella moellendorffii TaxID=88036 RepID=UPI000D1CD728|nr:warthog protein 6 isoform X2 [Selaginella moellendorffii]|eukprot:XP_024521178.1 warthog protein 6 isoform X2 [Selaginella moellendorffii]